LSGAQLLAGLSPAVTPIPFLAAGLLFAASIVPVMLTRIDAPPVTDVQRMPFRDIYRSSPFALTVSVAAGMNVGAFWTFTPFVARDMGLSVESTSALVASTVFAGLLWQWPAGFASDRFDRRHVVVTVCTIGAIAAFALVPAMSAERPLTLHVCFALLAGFFCLYPLTMAHALDHTRDPAHTLGVSQGLLMANGLGQTVGPLIGVAFITLLGPRGLPLYFLALLGGITAFTIWRLRVGVPVAPETQGKHVFVRTTTPAGAVLDPRLREGDGETP